MIFNENISNSNLQDTELILPQLNLLIPDVIYDEQKILKICNLIVGLKISSITVYHLFVPKIWKWLEKTNIKICALFDCNNFIENGQLNKNTMLTYIRTAINDGANIIDINQSNYINLNDELDLLNFATDSKMDIVKLTMNRNNINSADDIKIFLDSIYRKDIHCIKTESFINENNLNTKFKTKVADINAVFDFIQSQTAEQYFKLDIVANEIDENNFSFYDSVHMLHQSIFKNDLLFYKNCSFTCGLLRLNKILQ